MVVLLALARLSVSDERPYGMTIRLEIDPATWRCTGRSVSIGAGYATLRRLRDKGYVASSHSGEPTAERGGKAKRYFRLELAGAVALERSRAMFDELWSGVRRPRIRGSPRPSAAARPSARLSEAPAPRIEIERARPQAPRHRRVGSVAGLRSTDLRHPASARCRGCY